MKILFVNPSLRLNHPYKLLSVGLASVMTFIKEKGYEFDLLDIDINDHEDAYVEKFVRTHSYDVVLYGSIVTHYKWIKWFTKTIKQYHPSTKVIVGNSVAGSAVEVFMAHVPADVAVIGEGEETTLEVLEALRQPGSQLMENIEGIAYRLHDGSFAVNDRRKAKVKIDEFPMINWEFFDIERYKKKKISLIDDEDPDDYAFPVNTARGCAFRCSFCHFVFWDDPYRYRSPDSIVDEVQRNVDKYGTNTISFWDDLTFGGLGQVERLSNTIIERNIRFRWSCATRSDLFGNPSRPLEKRLRIAQLMKDAGCYSTGFALESGNKKILKLMNKTVEKEYFKTNLEILRGVGIKCLTSVVFGYPIETAATIRETFDMCLEAKMYPSIGFLLPLPYTGMYDYAKEHNFITDEDAYLDSITERQDICLNMTSMSDQEIMGLIQEGGSMLNEQLQIGLDSDSLIKTGGYTKALKAADQPTEKETEYNPPIDPKNMGRNENDVSFNYSRNTFDTTT